MSDQTLENELKQLVQNHSEIEAIKRYCNEMNVGVHEGKEEIERIKQLVYQDRIKQGNEVESVLIELIQEGKRIAAIKAYCEATNCTLLEGKKYIDQLSLTVDKEEHYSKYEDDEQVIIDLFLNKGKESAVQWYKNKYEIDSYQAKDFVDEILKTSELIKVRRKPNFLNKVLIVLVLILIVLLLNSFLS